MQEKFDLSVGVAAITGVRQTEGASCTISIEVARVEEELRSSYSIDEVKDVRTIRLQRDFFWRMGVDPTKVRPASKALLRRIVLNKGLPRVSPIVDAYNLASVKTLLTFSAFDLKRISPTFESTVFERGRGGDADRGAEAALNGIEILLT